MLCQKCQKRIADVYITQIINNVQREVHLCSECAHNVNFANIEMPKEINDFLSNYMGFNSEFAELSVGIQQREVCSRCGLNYKEFQEKGKLGCEKCYNVFEDRLEPTIRKIHRNVKHIGKTPKKFLKELKVDNDKKMLRKQLDEAIKEEKYEIAAEIRDKIKEMEGEN
jgi:protein arginine kinase activator